MYRKIISSTNFQTKGRRFEILFIAYVVRRSFDTFAVIYPLPTLATVEVCYIIYWHFLIKISYFHRHIVGKTNNQS